MENMLQQQRLGNPLKKQESNVKTDLKYHFISYLILNVTVWLGWLNYGTGDEKINGLAWPFYPMFFGAVALFFHFLAVYVFPTRTNGASK